MSDPVPVRLQALSAAPVLGVDMSSVSVLRLDEVGGAAAGNKMFKLRHNVQRARAAGVPRLVSFGGVWSNHLHALAALGAEMGLETIGLVRGGETETAMLRDAHRWGMQIVPVTRAQYRRRDQDDWLQTLQQRFGPCVIIPEGGANVEGLQGCVEIAHAINAIGQDFTRVVVSVGTATTLAGIAAALACAEELIGVAAVKGGADLETRADALLTESGLCAQVPWQILHDDHCGGFARVSGELQAFMLDFESVQGIQLEPVYTGKTLYAVYKRLASGHWRPGTSTLVIHTGGLQGRRGYRWLDEAAHLNPGVLLSRP